MHGIGLAWLVLLRVGHSRMDCGCEKSMMSWSPKSSLL